MNKADIEKKLGELDKEQSQKFEAALKDAGESAVVNLARRLSKDDGDIMNKLVSAAKKDNFAQITEYAKKIVSVEDEEEADKKITESKDIVKQSSRNTLINILKSWKLKNLNIKKLTTPDYKEFFGILIDDYALALPFVKISDTEGKWLKAVKVTKKYISQYENYFTNLTEEMEEGDIYIQQSAQLLKKKNGWVVGAKGKLGLVSPPGEKK